MQAAQLLGHVRMPVDCHVRAARTERAAIAQEQLQDLPRPVPVNGPFFMTINSRKGQLCHEQIA